MEKSNEQLLKEIAQLQAKIADLEKSDREHKNTEIALSISEEKFRNLFESSPLGKSMTGVDGSLQMNKAFCEMLGYTEEELRSKHWKEITHPDDVQESINIVQDMLDGKKDRAFYKKRYIHKNGNIIWSDIVTVLKRDKNNNPEYFITSVRDTTEQKHSEERIASFSRIFEDSLNEIYLFDAETFMFTQVNNAAMHNLGYTMEELKVITPIDIKPEFTQEKFNKLVEPLQTGKKGKIVFETIHQRKDKSLYNVEVHLQLTIFEGRATFVAMILDITDRKQAENELAKLQLLYDETEKAAKIGGWTFDIETMEQTWTDEIFRILEIDLSMGAPKVPEGIAFIDPPYRQMAELAIQKSIENGEPYEQEWLVTTSKGNKRWVMAIANPYIENGKTIKISGSFQDITDRKQAETKLLREKEYAEELINALPGLFYQISIEGKFVNWNKNFETASGYSAEEIGKMSPVDLFEVEDKAHIANRIRSVFIDGKADVAAELVSKEKEKTPYYFTGKQIILDDIPILVGMGIDVSSLKKAENELKKYREHLEELVKERTKDLETKNKELDNAMKVFVGRELTIRNLQDRIRALEGK